MAKASKNNPRITGSTAKKLLLLAVGALTLISAAALAQILNPCATMPLDSGAAEISSDLYANPQLVAIDGYDGDSMEPFITGEGNYLLFNNLNSALVDTHIHLCKRVGTNSFQHLGLLSGSVSKSKDMAPSIDADGHLYFTSLRSFDKDGHSIYVGNFEKETLKSAELPNGDISPHLPATINMDCDVSKDGKTLVLSRAHFVNPLLPPAQSDLILATKQAGVFSVDPNKQNVLSNINTQALEYAPCLSADQLELYFTRASLHKKADGKAGQPYLRIMVAKRENKDLPFGKPAVLKELTGFIEAPTITNDKHELFFHKKVGDKFRIFCAKRNKI